MTSDPPALIEQQPSDYQLIHCFVYADPGRKKSTFAATFPKPMLVLGFDAYSKMSPYRRRGKRGPQMNIDGTPTEFIMSAQEPDRAIIQLEQYYDEDIYDARAEYAWERFRNRIATLHQEVRDGMWATVVLDSCSSLEFAIRKYEEYKANPVTKKGNDQDQRQHYHRSSSGVEEICYTMAWLPCNVVVLAHVRMEKDNVRGTVYWTPEVPGVKNRRLPGAFGEVYTMHCDPAAEKDEERFYLQTIDDGNYIAATQIPAPEYAQPHYKALWTHYKPEQD